MKTIITPGTNSFYSTCYRCGCAFSYQYEDLTCKLLDGYSRTTTGEKCVICPCCGEYLAHSLPLGDIRYETTTDSAH